MNRDCKEFNNDSFIYPLAEGVYTPREFSYYKNDFLEYAVSSYYKDREEGVITVGDNHVLVPAESGYARNPVSVIYKGIPILFWSEYKEGWYVKGSIGAIPRIEGDLFVHSASTDTKGNIYLACVRQIGYLKSDILLLIYDGISWSISKRLNLYGVFCNRPVVASYGNKTSVVWDSYDDGYNIYLCNFLEGKVSDGIKVSKGTGWNLKPSAAYDENSKLWITWLKTTDVERDGIIAKINQVMMAAYDGNQFEYIYGNESKEVVSLDIGLLPGKRYFGYHGLRRNPQISCFKNGDVGLFWESQRDETEMWDNVENGWFQCMIYNGSWNGPYMIQDGGNCFTVDPTHVVDTEIHYAYRGARDNGSDIKFNQISVGDLNKHSLPKYDEWNNWKPMLPKKNSITTGLYWGDLHCHSIYSPDAEGYPDELFFYARDVSKIDFCAITDNDIYGDNILTKSALRYIQSLCNHISKDDEFLAFAGYEWTYHKPGLDEPENFNHRTIIFLDDDITIASRADSSGHDEQSFCQTLKESDTMWHAHHGIWQILDQAHDVNVEVVSAWTNNIEYFNTVHEQLAEGHVFGFMGASDNHRFIPGHGGALTGVFSDRLTKADLKAAFFNRKNYATCGCRVIVDFFIIENMMNINIVAGRGIEYISIISDGRVMMSFDNLAKSFNKKVDIPLPVDKTYYYLKIKLNGEDKEFEHNLAMAEGNYVYTSPIWIG